MIVTHACIFQLAVRDLQVLVDSCSALTSLHVGVGTGEVVDVGEILSKLPNLESLVLKGTFKDQSFQYGYLHARRIRR